MATQTITTTPVVIAVDRTGCRVRSYSGARWLTWDVLDAACSQADRDLATAYQQVRDRAHAMVCDARDLPIIVHVTDDTHTGWRYEVSARTVDGGYFPLRGRGLLGADEGGTTYWRIASQEADDVIARLQQRGYTDVRRAR